MTGTRVVPLLIVIEGQLTVVLNHTGDRSTKGIMSVNENVGHYKATALTTTPFESS